jgi:hypothetical protein
MGWLRLLTSCGVAPPRQRDSPDPTRPVGTARVWLLPAGWPARSGGGGLGDGDDTRRCQVRRGRRAVEHRLGRETDAAGAGALGTVHASSRGCRAEPVRRRRVRFAAAAELQHAPERSPRTSVVLQLLGGVAPGDAERSASARGRRMPSVSTANAFHPERRSPSTAFSISRRPGSRRGAA